MELINSIFPFSFMQKSKTSALLTSSFFLLTSPLPDLTGLTKVQAERCILQRMKELGISQPALAKRMNASRPYVVKVLHGDVNITLGSAARFAEALQLDFFPLLVQPATGERYAFHLPRYQHFSAMGPH